MTVPTVPCKWCGNPTIYPVASQRKFAGTKECEPCLLVSSKLEQFVRSEKGRELVLSAVGAAYRRDYPELFAVHHSDREIARAEADRLDGQGRPFASEMRETRTACRASSLPPVSAEQIEQLQEKAIQRGKTSLIRLCCHALVGDSLSWRECTRQISWPWRVVDGFGSVASQEDYPECFATRAEAESRVRHLSERGWAGLKAVCLDGEELSWILS